MNLKEAFRYQNFLDTLLNGAVSSLTHPNHCLKVTKTHHCSKANSEAEDFVEEVEAGRFLQKRRCYTIHGVDYPRERCIEQQHRVG